MIVKVDNLNNENQERQGRLDYAGTTSCRLIVLAIPFIVTGRSAIVIGLKICDNTVCFLYNRARF